MYYDVSDEQAEIKAPLILDIKGAAGEWVLVKSKSRVDVLRGELDAIHFQINGVREKILLGQPITLAEKIRLRSLEPREAEIIKQLTDYGYPPL